MSAVVYEGDNSPLVEITSRNGTQHAINFWTVVSITKNEYGIYLWATGRPCSLVIEGGDESLYDKLLTIWRRWV